MNVSIEENIFIHNTIYIKKVSLYRKTSAHKQIKGFGAYYLESDTSHSDHFVENLFVCQSLQFQQILNSKNLNVHLKG